MKTINVYILLASIFLFSCDKGQDSITVYLDQSGTFKVKVLDNNENAIEGADVGLYYDRGSYMITSETTNTTGEVDFGKLLQGCYWYYMAVEKAGLEYQAGELFQVLTGNETYKTATPFNNVGNLSVKIVDNYNVALSNINIALIPENIYSNSDFDDLISKAYFIDVTNASGWVYFNDVPSGPNQWYNRYYSVVAYYDSSNYAYSYANLYVYPESDHEYTIEINYITK